MYKKVFIVITFVFLIFSNLFPFGKNKVQYRGFEWYYIQSKNFDIYYYDSTYNLACFTADVAEAAYNIISKDFNHKLQDRLSIIVYKSHNHFQQTNVIQEFLEEGIGGVTELYKNRVVIPFEGDYEQFRHVIHHELVHGIMNDMLYGGNIQSLITGKVSQVPLWVAEGIAEFESQGWNNQLDMAVRDAVVNNYMPPIWYLSYYLPYQGGASVFWYISETYGREKIGELFGRLRGKVRFNKVIEKTFGVKIEEFSRRWHRWLKKMYWDDYSKRIIPREFADIAIDHQKFKNYLNVSPALSPDGSYMAFVSNKDGYQSIYLYSIIKNKIISKLIKGTKSESFEELHLLRPGISFSPDSKKLAFTAKSKGKDWIYIKNISTNKMEKFVVDLDGVYSVSWSPNGKYIAFIGNHQEASDIYLLNVANGQYSALTTDVFSDDMPSWSPNGDKIVFVSNRQHYLDDSQLSADFKMTDYNYSQTDIYEITIATKEIKRITNTPWMEQFPLYIEDGDRYLYTSYENGVSNIYYYNKSSNEKRVLSNVVTGIFQLSLTKDFKKLAFVSFSYGGFDIFTVNNPLNLKIDKMENTHFQLSFSKFEKNIKQFYENKKFSKDKVAKNKSQLIKKNYSDYVFGRDMYSDNKEIANKKKKKRIKLELPKEKIMNEEGDYYVRKYKINLSPDYVVGQAGYDTYFGVQGYTQFSFSDLMGNYKIMLNTNLYFDLKSSNYAVTILNLKNRIDYGIGGYNYSNSLYSYGSFRFRNYGVTLFGSYGFSRYRRIDFGAIWSNALLEDLSMQKEINSVSAIIPRIDYVFDNVLYGYTGPVAGTRYIFSISASPKLSDKGKDFKTFTGDFRKYFMFNPMFQFATRLTSGISIGQNPQQFFLGGVTNWFNRKFNDGMRVNIDDIYFSSFVTPMRGGYYYERTGDRYVMTNLEFRFPLINLISFGLPPITLGNIRGVAFTDIGTAWYKNEKVKLFDKDEFGSLHTKDLFVGCGLGAHLYLFGFLVRYDVAWRYDLENYSKPIYYFSLGSDF